MNTVFKILWYEDTPTWYNMAKIKVEEILEQHYLIPDIINKDGDDFNISEFTGNEYDLILMDFALADGLTGDEIVMALRKSDILTDVLFYSSQEELMIETISKYTDNFPPLDGFYITKRDHNIFLSKVELLIEKIIKRSEDLVNLRGFVMDGTCDFEVRIQEILNFAWEKFNEEQKAIMNGYVFDKIKSNEKRDNKTKEKVLKNNPIFPAANNDKHFFTNTDRLYLLSKAIKILQDEYGFIHKEEYDNFQKSYEDNISKYRNPIGHKKVSEDKIKIENDYVMVDRDLHQKMRINLNKYDNLIREIETFITEKI